MMKNKHNKKRNTAFIYEALVKEATVAVLRNETDRKQKIVNLFRKHFKGDSLLYKELMCYRSLYENQGLNKQISEKIMKEAKIAQRLIDPDGLFKQQTELINDINKEVAPSVFNNYVPNYRTLATIAQIFSDKLSPKNSVILENQIIENMTSETPAEVEDLDVDKLVVKNFVEKFNTKYSDALLEEQKELLSRYISSFSDNALELKMFLNEEIERLKASVAKAKNSAEFQSDETMLERADTILEKLDSFAQGTISDRTLITIMKTQKLVKEIYTDGDNS
tara:strand:- start:446 stop:1282 length:837 start_codon:yes stop_codon:yes gene_type:complete